MTLTNGYCTREQLRQHFGYDVNQTKDDAKLDLAINAASRQIDRWCGRRFWQDAALADRQYVSTGHRVFVDDIATTVGLVVKADNSADGTFATTLATNTDFVLLPANAADEIPVRPYSEIVLSTYSNFPYSFTRWSSARPNVQVTAKFGWPAVPDEVTQACLIQAAQLHDARNAVFGVIALGDTQARTLRAALNPMAEALLADYQRPPIA